ncbi:MAG: DUF4147 domain-containing protein, partial [Thaumarchaeota archaeon]|nr:DUF4147 domain-containing protein [Nitrososphaerota archaeon]
MPLKIKNKADLLSKASGLEESSRRLLIDVLEHVLSTVDPYSLVKSSIKLEDGYLKAGKKSFSLKNRKITVVGGGKAAAGMALALEDILGNRIEAGAVNIPRGVSLPRSLRKIKVSEADHPIPSENGVRGVERMLALLKGLSSKDLVICLISGGGSALMPMPAEGVTLEDKGVVTQMLLDSGATINELNAVRKHLSAVKGGRLAVAAHHAETLVLTISDVVGDALDTIASGPCAPDSTTFQDAIGVLKRHNVWQKVPERVRNVLSKGLKGEISETPKKGDAVFKRVTTLIIGNNLTACSAAREALEEKGFNTLILTSRLQGEASHAGILLASIAKEADASGNPIKRPAALIAGGETVVKVVGKGVGGRNQELMLSAALSMTNVEMFAAVSMGTDGIDGPTGVAGALIDSQTITRARALSLNPGSFLENN